MTVPAPSSPSATGRRVLIVDDNRDAAESLGELLRMLDHEVELAFDGVEGVAAAERFAPELVLMDIGMPRLDGYGACAQIRARPWGAGMRIIAQTGWGQDDDKRRADAAGFDGHLVKPVEVDAILQLLDTLG